MSPQPAKFTEIDVRRAAKAAWAVDPNARVQIVLTDGTKIILEKGQNAPQENELAKSAGFKL